MFKEIAEDILTYGAPSFLSLLKKADEKAYTNLLLACQDSTAEELDAIKTLKVAHYGDNVN